MLLKKKKKKVSQFNTQRIELNLPPDGSTNIMPTPLCVALWIKVMHTHTYVEEVDDIQLL